jgi:poly-gamma-glutamate capsule biosynthesis protein CapA/YwtB (metallophosphatase superfamily)
MHAPALMVDAYQTKRSYVWHADAVITLAAVGDVLVDREDASTAFALARDRLAADIVFGNCEGPYSDTAERNGSSWGWVLSTPASLPALGAFDVMSVANNHIMDAGYRGLSDTLAGLRDAGVAPVGAGADLAEARSPVFVEREGVTVGFLAYTTVYAPGFAAWSSRPGCATVEVHTVYRSELGQPGTRPQVQTFVDPPAKAAVSADVAAARPRCDVLVVSMHWGVHNLPAVLADYERELGHALVDAGADVVLGHHQHIVKGVEVYRGKPILYGLGNFLFDTSTEKVLERSAVAREAFAGFAPFYGAHLSSHPDARRAMLVRLRLSAAGLEDVAIVPCRQDDRHEPAPVDPGSDEFGAYLAYLREITVQAGLNGRISVRGDELVLDLAPS